MQDIFKELKALGLEGFPFKLIQSFFHAADQTKHSASQVNEAIIMTRVPGFSTTQLLKENYDTKGYHIKAKSCNWGPMAGFLCKLPPFNKKGVVNMQSNYKSNSKYYEKCKNFKSPFRKNLTSPFHQIKITDKRKQEIVKIKEKYNIHQIEEMGDYVWGYASDKADISTSTIIMDFILQKVSVDEIIFWNLYHGQVRIQVEGTGIQSYTKYKASHQNIYSNVDISGFSKIILEPMNILRGTGQQKINNLYNNSDLKTRNLFSESTHVFSAIEGIWNLESLDKQTDTAKDFKNTVTGDYDLFAIWPVKEVRSPRIEPLGLNNLLKRESEKKFLSDQQLKMHFSIIQDFPSKHLPFIIQVIPHGGELGELEHPNHGNYNEIGLISANILNKTAALNTKTDGFKYRLAHHSDEGGRPDVKTLDLPVAVFLPKCFKEIGNYKSNAFLIKTPGNFLDFCKACNRTYATSFSSTQSAGKKVFKKFPLIINHGWLVNLIAYCFDDQQWTHIRNLVKNKAEFEDFKTEVDEQKASEPPAYKNTVNMDAILKVFFPVRFKITPTTKHEEFFNTLTEILFKYTFNGDAEAKPTVVDLKELINTYSLV